MVTTMMTMMMMMVVMTMMTMIMMVMMMMMVAADAGSPFLISSLYLAFAHPQSPGSLLLLYPNYTLLYYVNHMCLI